MPYVLVDLLRRKQIPEEENCFLHCCCLCFSLQTFLITHDPQQPDWMAICFMTPVCSHMCKEWAVSWGQILGFYCWRVKIVICIIASEIWSRYGALTSQAWLTNATDKATLWKVHELADLQLTKACHPLVHLLDHPPSSHNNQPTIQTGLWQQILLPTLKTSVCMHTQICKMVPNITFSSVRYYLEGICWYDTMYPCQDPTEQK